MQRSFLGQVMTSRPCPQCQGYGTLIPHPCPECSGEGRVRTRRTITVKIPAGVDTGTRIQLSGEGEVGPGAGPAGDLFLEIVEQPHETFTRQGDDLHCTLTLPMTAAALGTSIDLTTLDGVEAIVFEPNSTPVATKSRDVPKMTPGRAALVVRGLTTIDDDDRLTPAVRLIRPEKRTIASLKAFEESAWDGVDETPWRAAWAKELSEADPWVTRELVLVCGLLLARLRCPAQESDPAL